jgi:hypothetical protein
MRRYSTPHSGEYHFHRRKERRALQLLDHVSDRVCLAGTCNAEPGLVRKAAGQPLDKFSNGLRLIAGRLVVCVEFESDPDIVSSEWAQARLHGRF